MFFNRGMDTENVVHLHNGVHSAMKNNDFMKFLGKWMKVENIILTGVTQSQHTWHAFSDNVISGNWPQISEYLIYNSQIK